MLAGLGPTLPQLLGFRLRAVHGRRLSGGML